MIRYDIVENMIASFKGSDPFDHCIIDNFFEEEAAEALERDFLFYDDPAWYTYDNAIENKKALNSWEKFPSTTYCAFNELHSVKMTSMLSVMMGQTIFVDHGLNGGGWHIHGDGGNLNPHLDYSIHPKLGLERVLNIIIYLSRDMDPEFGGHLGLWRNDPGSDGPGELVREIEPIFNRAVIFDTTQNSWHGMSRPLSVPAGVFRKSLAVYYLREPDINASSRGRALFAPRAHQIADESVLETIRLRSRVETSSLVYRRGEDVGDA